MVLKIVFVTGNANKLKEVKMLLAPNTGEEPAFDLTNTDIDLDELQSSSLEDIARHKVAQAISTLPKGVAVFVEDTALCFNALNGLPGAYIKWFLKSVGPEGIVRMLEGFDNKGAEAVTTVAYADAEGQIHMFQGRTQGKIVSPRGSRDFGWDCCFEPTEGGGSTYAEMAKSDKNKISQRSKAFALLKQYLNGLQAN
ncbi:LANO_0F15654g1_1 [Lachancea nothofagi CBS 11611]|uniref:Inosine triphosphate pyrophosphatase n=1 Tax=Lachancea nothofagi CBS 11611 TaxID=1266666 RepID=A0A1G4KCM0_9SACH|nr:LANO_0F15654g1_1 [Lachancea nothofagi CBS 11611]